MKEEFIEMDQAAQEYNEVKDQYKYIAFISYRHLTVDIRVAKAIHTMIETFKLPKEFYQDGKKPQFRVFRDREELSTNSLSRSIQDALKHSKYLIVICSKRFNDSFWCRVEVKTFIKLHGIHRVIPILVEGEPEESFPKELLPDSSTDNKDIEGEAKDILAAELRSEPVKSPDFPGFESLEKNNPSRVNQLAELAVKCLKEEKYRIMAAILGVSLGDLKQRDKVRRQRRLILLSGIISVSLLFFGILMFNAYRSENQAKRQTLQDKAHFMLMEAENLIAEGDRFKGVILAENAMKELDSSMTSYNELKEQHLRILNETVGGQLAGYNRVIATGNEFTFLDINPKNKTFVAGLNNDSIALYDVVTGNLLKTATGHTQQVKILTFSEDRERIISGGFDDVLNLWHADSLELLATNKAAGNIMLAKFNNDDQYLDVIYDTSEAYVYQRYDAETLKEIGSYMYLNPNIKRVAFDGKGDYMWVNYGASTEEQTLIKYDLNTRNEVKNYLYTDSEGKKQIYADIRMSSSGKFLFARAGNDLIKMDVENDELIFQKPKFFSSLTAEPIVIAHQNEETLYVADGIKIFKLDSQTGKQTAEISPGYSVIKEMQTSREGDVLLVLQENGELLVIRDGHVVNSIPNTSNSTINYIYLTDEGNNALTLSLQNQEIKIVSLRSDSEDSMKNGQLVISSPDGHYGLIYHEQQFYVLDANQNTIVKQVNDKTLGDGQAFVSNYAGFLMANNGRYMTTVNQSETAVAKVNILDIDNNETLMSIDLDRDRFRIGFSPDSTQIFIMADNDEVSFFNINDGKEAFKIKIDKGALENVFISQDGQYFVAQYIESISKIYDLKSKEKVIEINGSVISMDRDEEGKSRIVALYNNIGTTYIDFKKVGMDINFTNQLKFTGEYGKSRHLFNAKNQLLLTIRAQGDVYHAYLINFATGKLIKEFEFNNSMYPMNAFISNDGKRVFVDTYYGFIRQENAENIFYSNYRAFNLLDYEILLKKAKEQTDDVKLTDEEKRLININY